MQMNVSSYQNATVMACSLCRDAGSILTTVQPVYPVLDYPLSIPPGLSCRDLDTLGASQWSQNDTACTAWRIAFSGECCAGEDLSEPVPTYQCEQSVHATLLDDGSGYSTTAVPIPGKTPLNVSVSIMFLHATELSTVAGTAELFFGFFLSWTDERLVWDPKEHGGCDRFYARASLDAEKTDIWVADFDLLNRASGLQELPDASAMILSNGTVEWGRLGGIKAICLFEGLERFPFDELECEFMFGSSLSSPVHYILNQDALFAQSRYAKYQEYTIIPERTTVSYRTTLIHTQMRIRFVFERASRYYTTTIVAPTILFTFVSFGMFLLDIRVGERLAFGVSLLLVIVANSILTAGMLPICAERLWINVLTKSSYYWVMAALTESIIVAYLFFLETEDMERENSVREGSQAGEHNGQTSEVPVDHTPSQGSKVDAEESDRSPVVENRPGMMRQKAFRLTLKHILISSPRPSLTWRMKAIRHMDRICIVIFPITYIAFFSTMLARNKYW